MNNKDKARINVMSNANEKRATLYKTIIKKLPMSKSHQLWNTFKPLRVFGRNKTEIWGGTKQTH